MFQQAAPCCVRDLIVFGLRVSAPKRKGGWRKNGREKEKAGLRVKRDGNTYVFAKLLFLCVLNAEKKKKTGCFFC